MRINGNAAMQWKRLLTEAHAREVLRYLHAQGGTRTIKQEHLSHALWGVYAKDYLTQALAHCVEQGWVHMARPTKEQGQRGVCTTYTLLDAGHAACAWHDTTAMERDYRARVQARKAGG